MRTPGMDKTGPVPVKPPAESMPVEQLVQQRKEGQAAPPATMPLPARAGTRGHTAASVNPGLTPTAAAGGAAK